MKKEFRLYLKSKDYHTTTNDTYNFSSVTFPLSGIPMDYISDMLKNEELEIRIGWYKIYNYDDTPFMIGLKNIHQRNIFSSTKQLGTSYLSYGQYDYELYDWNNLPPVVTSDYSFLHNRSLTIEFLNPETEQVLANNAFGSTTTSYALTLIISYHK